MQKETCPHCSTDLVPDCRSVIRKTEYGAEAVLEWNDIETIYRTTCIQCGEVVDEIVERHREFID